MSNVPLPRPGPLGLIQYAGVDMLQYAGEISAAKDAEIAGLRAELFAHQVYIRVLCKAVDAATDFAGTVAGGASWWDDVWAEHFRALDAARAELIKSLADNAALRADAIDRQNNVVAPLRERVRELTTQAMFNASTIERLRAEVAGLRAFVEHVRRNGSTHLAGMAIAVLAALESGRPC